MPLGSDVKPLPAPRKAAVDCDVADYVQPQDGTTLALTANDTAGTFSAGEVTLPAGVLITMTGDLTIVGLSLIDIQGDIYLPVQTAPGARAFNLSIVCLGGQVVIGGLSRIGYGEAAPGAAATSTGVPSASQAQPGQSGGYIRIYGATVDCGGFVTGTQGGFGGDATTDNSAPTRVQKALAQIPFLRGRAAAAAGSGGHGGDVRFCVVELLHLGSNIAAGRGGNGGGASASSDGGGTARARGGHGGSGGDIVITKVGAGAPLLVYIDHFVEGGWGGDGRQAWAWGYNAPGMACGGALASGGDGGAGGTVKFENCTVMKMGTVWEGGGGLGWTGDSTAGDGDNGFFLGSGGASAEATGGNGGALGAPVAVPLGAGVVVPPPPGGTPPVAGGGGTATAQPGSGGNATGWLGRGGSSGTAVANGGANGAGSAPAAPVTTAATPPVGKAGGAGAVSTASQPGIP